MKPIQANISQSRPARANSSQRGYGAWWQRASAAYLSSNRHCVMCRAIGRRRKAVLVDHKIPHKDNEALRRDPANWQALCKPCHDGPKQSQDRTGKVKGVDANGNPLDPNHEWNKVRAVK